MRHFRIIFGHEIRMLLVSPSSYVAAVLFLVIMSFLYTASIQIATTEYGDTLPTTLFFQGFFIPVCFMVPLLTMRALAEERRMGTLESLLTTPATPAALVLAKFGASYLLYLAMWALTLGFPMVLDAVSPELTARAQLWDWASLGGGYAFIALSGSFYIGIGLFCSSLTRSQLVAGMLTFCLLFLVILGSFFLGKLPLAEDLASTPFWSEPAQYFQSFTHLEDFSRGYLDTRPLVLYATLTALLLGLTTMAIEAKGESNR